MTRDKIFEKKVKENWIDSIPNSSIDRIYDSVSGYKGVSNISDFIAYKRPLIFYLEVKTIKGNTFPLRNLTQYDKLLQKKGIDGVRSGVIIWFYEHDNKIIYVPIATIQQMKLDGKKSVNIRTIDRDGYRYIQIPSVKLRVYYNSDYSVLLETQEGE